MRCIAVLTLIFTIVVIVSEMSMLYNLLNEIVNAVYFICLQCYARFDLVRVDQIGKTIPSCTFSDIGRPTNNIETRRTRKKNSNATRLFNDLIQ